MTPRWTIILYSALLIGVSAEAHAARLDSVRDLAGRVGPIIGSASACRDIARPRIQSIVEKFNVVIQEAASNDAERDDLARLLDRNVTDGRLAVTTGKIDCTTAGRQLAALEQSLDAPAPVRRAYLPLPLRRPPPRLPVARPAALSAALPITKSALEWQAPSRAPPRNSGGR